MRRLGVGPDRQRIVQRVLRGEHGAAFHGMRRAAMLEQLFREHMRGAGEGLVDVAVADGKLGRDVVGAAGMGDGGAG